MEIWAVVKPEKYNKHLWYKILYVYSTEEEAAKKAKEIKITDNEVFVGKLEEKIS